MIHSAKSLVATIAIFLATVLGAPGLSGQTSTRSADIPIIQFFSGDFWLNLHHFLYVLGRAQTGAPDAKRPEVAGAPTEQDAQLGALTQDEQSHWRQAVAFYAGGLSKLDPVFDDKLIAVTRAVAGVADAASLDSASPALPADLAALLQRAAPVYRKAWWPAHRRGNEQWVKDTKALVDVHGRQVLAFLRRAYQLEWPAEGYPVHVTAYANWAGAYSTDGPLLVISSLDTGTVGPAALETVFHEATHQWDDPIQTKLDEIGRQLGKKVPAGLTHAMIWMTAGEAVRRVIPGYVPIAEAGGLWERGSSPRLRPSLERAWLPYLNGAGTRDDALMALMKLTGIG